MAYEYENDILELLKDIEREQSLDLSKEINEVQEAYQTARLIDNIVITTKKRLTEQERKAKAFDEIKERFEKEYKAEVFEESLYHPENFDNSEFLEDVEHILYFEDVRYVEIEEDD